MNNIKIFNHEQFGEVRATYDKEMDQVWFVAKDITNVLGIKNTTVALQGLEDFERTKLNLGRQGSTNAINESGMYSLVMRSRKEAAKKFRVWVTSEVLPSIRKHGAYMTPDKIEEVLLNPDVIIQLATNLKEEQEKRKQLEIENNEMKPKALFAESVESSNDSILVGQLAKLIKQNGYDIGQNRLFKWLRDNGYLIKRKGEDYNTPTQKSMDLKLMEIKKITINNPDGSIRVSKTPKVTGKGQIYFVNKFLER